MATTHSLNDKGWQNSSLDDWHRNHWLNSYAGGDGFWLRLNLARGAVARRFFQVNTIHMPYHNMLTLGCRKCGRWLETRIFLQHKHLSGFGAGSVSVVLVLTDRNRRDLVREWNYTNR